MSKIYLSGNRVFDVPKIEAERIEQEWSHKAEFIKINDNVTVKNREIKRIEKQGGGARPAYDLNNPADKRAILDFERFCEDLKANASLVNLLDYYGYPIKNQEKFPGCVNNEILGAVHWSLVQWALDEKIISRRENMGVNWAILASISGYGEHQEMDVGRYADLDSKLKAIDKLQDRRIYAQKKEQESLNLIAEKESFAKSTQMSKAEVEELPF